MERATGLLEQVRVASPCRASWDTMEGDEACRFCSACGKNVYNLSALTAPEAEALIREKEGRLCVRFYRRRDGTLLTSNCPVGLRAARRWLLAHVGGATAAFGGIALAGTLLRSETFQSLRHSRLAGVEPFRSFFEWLDPTPNPLPVVGALAPMPLPPSTPTGM